MTDLDFNYAQYLSSITNDDVTVLRLPDNAIITSNSEVDAFGSCERKHLFGFVYNRESKYPSRPLALGLAGHEILATYYKSVKANKGKLQAERDALAHLSKFYIEHTYEPEVLNMLAMLFSRYVKQDTIPTTCEVLAVEEDFYMPTSPLYWYGMRLDLLVKVLVGEHKGHIMLVDHKFTYDFWSDDDLALNPQLPKYVPAVRLSGFPVHDAYINQIRWRFATSKIDSKSNEDLFRMSPIGITQAQIRSAVMQQVILSERIVHRNSEPEDEQFINAVPIRNKLICKSCPYRRPCIMMNNEEDISGLLLTSYRRRTYGYLKAQEDGTKTTPSS